MLPAPYDALHRALSTFIAPERLVTDPLRLLAWGTDASFYRLVPKLVVVVDSENEVQRLLAHCAELGTPVTFRAAGTSLSGQAISDSVLAVLGEGWRGISIADDASTITLQPGVIGSRANQALAPHGRKIGPDPASIDSAMIGGIAANNSSGMCCGTAQNSYNTLAGVRVILADGTVLDTRDAQSRAAFRAAHPDWLEHLARIARSARDDVELAARIRHKFRMKNTTGYSLNALIDFDDPIDVAAHLMIGSEGTLGFICAVSYETVPEHPHKASALVLFADIASACRAVSALTQAPVSAVELADRAALRSVENKPGMPDALRTLAPQGAALLIETRAPDAARLQAQIDAVAALLAPMPIVGKLRFVGDASESAKLWNVRKGMFPSVGAMRRTGTTVIIEDVAFPVARLAEATLDLQQLLRTHGYAEAIIFGHALAGNLHFVFTQDFNDAAEVARYARFMDALSALVVGTYDGSLKAEHGTGRNMAPFVELEWGAQATALMHRIKALFDPRGLLNPGVIINADPRAHLANLKPLPAADALVDACIECGFCEPKCPSRGLTLSPRQRIVGWRELNRLEHENAPADTLAQWRAAYDYQGIDTCAACGLCATACPVGIETGVLIKSLRGRRAGALAHRLGAVAATHYAAVTAGARAGLGAMSIAHALLGTRVMRAASSGLRRVSGGATPRWSPSWPRPARFTPPSPSTTAHASYARRVVYFPSCAARAMGGACDGPRTEPLPETAQRLFRRAGFDIVYPHEMARLCCGQPFESKGLFAVADAKSAELERALAQASEGGRLLIVFDTSPCAYRMKRYLQGRLAVLDGIEFLRDEVLPRVRTTPAPASIAIHAVCSVRKMGLVDALGAIARACSTSVVVPDGVQCCGFAGDKGFTVPELNAHALRHLACALPADCHEGYSTSRTCEIGLSERAGFAYRSIIALVEERAAAAAAVDEATAAVITATR